MITLIAILGFMVSGSLANLDADSVCQLMVDGTKLRNVEFCDQYYVCRNGKATEYSCPNGYQFNKDKEDCVTPRESTCGIIPDSISKICDGKPVNSWQADPDSCDGFYYCNGKEAQKGACPDGQHFNPDIQECVHAGKDFECSKGTLDADDKNSICLMVPSNKFFGVATNCREWAVCRKGIYESGLCDKDDSNVNFDLSDGLCGYDKTCKQTESNVKPGESTDTDERPATNGKCDKPNTYTSDGTCSGFYWCSNLNQWQRGICSNGRAFDANSNKCVPRSDKLCNSCQNTKGVYTWVNKPNDCSKYYYCQDNKIHSEGTCSSGYFNVLLQRCESKLTNYAACESKDKVCEDLEKKKCDCNSEGSGCKESGSIECKDVKEKPCTCNDKEDGCATPVCYKEGTDDTCDCNEKNVCKLDENFVCRNEDKSCDCNGPDLGCEPVCRKDGIEGFCKCNDKEDSCAEPVCYKEGTDETCDCNEKNVCKLDEKIVCRNGDKPCDCNGPDLGCEPVCHRDIEGLFCKCNDDEDGCAKQVCNKEDPEEICHCNEKDVCKFDEKIVCTNEKNEPCDCNEPDSKCEPVCHKDDIEGLCKCNDNENGCAPPVCKKEGTDDTCDCNDEQNGCADTPSVVDKPTPNKKCRNLKTGRKCECAKFAIPGSFSCKK